MNKTWEELAKESADILAREIIAALVLNWPTEETDTSLGKAIELLILNGAIIDNRLHQTEQFAILTGGYQKSIDNQKDAIARLTEQLENHKDRIEELLEDNAALRKRVEELGGF